MDALKVTDKIKQKWTEWTEPFVVVDFCQLSKANWRFFCGILKTNKTIRGLQIDGKLSVAAARLFAKAMEENQTLTYLTLSSIHESGMKYLCNAMQDARSLIGVTLGDQFRFNSDESLQLFCGSLNHLVLLHLHQADDLVGFEIAKALKTNTSLTDLIFTDCENNGTGLSKEAHRELGEALAVNKSLMKLQLSDCGTDDEDYLNVMAGLVHNNCLNTFYITSKHITQPYLPLANLLKVNSKLTDLWVDVEQLDSEGLFAFAEIMKKNTTVSKLSIPQADPDEVQAVAEILKVNRTLTEINVTEMNYPQENDDDYFHRHEETASLIGEALKDNDSVYSVKLWSNEEEAFSVQDIMLEHLSHNKALVDIGLIDEEACSDLVNLLAANKKRQASDHKRIQKAMSMIASSANALDIFPEEIWLNIFRFIYFPGADYHTRFDETLKTLFALRRAKAAPAKLNPRTFMSWFTMKMQQTRQPFDPLISGDKSSNEDLSEIAFLLVQGLKHGLRERAK